jgi:hypothetical protein
MCESEYGSGIRISLNSWVTRYTLVGNLVVLYIRLPCKRAISVIQVSAVRVDDDRFDLFGVVRGIDYSYRTTKLLARQHSGNVGGIGIGAGSDLAKISGPGRRASLTTNEIGNS